jgi:hypothetical protein
VLHNPQGDRVFVRQAPDKPYGTKARDTQGRKWEYRRATMPEVEANTDVRYLHDPVLTSLQNDMQLRTARRNVETLKGDILPELERKGLAATDAESRSKLGFQETKVPTLRGHYFEPPAAGMVSISARRSSTAADGRGRLDRGPSIVSGMRGATLLASVDGARPP